MERLAVLVRSMQLFAHIGHNRVSGPTFFEDHEFLGGLYETYEGVYDSLIERMIGLGESPDLWQVSADADKKLQGMKANNSAIGYLSRLLTAEEEIGTVVDELVDEGELSQATINLLAQIADDSEVRRYKIQQRLGKLAVTEKTEDALDRIASEQETD